MDFPNESLERFLKELLEEYLKESLKKVSERIPDFFSEDSQEEILKQSKEDFLIGFWLKLLRILR